ncbi:RHS repeat-associated core domain-containing protein [Corallococcus sicarius]|uniref:RHS repeat-associated core domain-containing protein n=1 Tax=Corallococcus sicarius TaxID=2316726 RepID=UPI0011C48FA5|nr:RHS repeat-associated core domain-containing protein [Corallococcus sicarius]
MEERLAGHRQPALLYTQGAGMAVAVGAERIAHDGMGSAVGRYPATGAGARQQYDAWGNFLGGTGPSFSQPSLGYTGHAWDADSGLHYAQQRWLDTPTGRFLSEDPVGAHAYLTTPNEMSAWLYVAGNPLKYADPDGQELTWAGAKQGASNIARSSANAFLAFGEMANRALTLGYNDKAGYYVDENGTLLSRSSQYYKERGHQAFENKQRALEILSKGPNYTGAVFVASSFEGAVEGIGGTITKAAQNCYHAHISRGADDEGTRECVEALPGAVGGTVAAWEIATGAGVLIDNFSSGIPSTPLLSGSLDGHEVGRPLGGVGSGASDLADASKPMLMGAKGKSASKGKRRVVYRQLSQSDRAAYDAGDGLSPKGDGGSIADHVAGGGNETEFISASMTEDATRRYGSGNGLVEIDVDLAMEAGAGFVDHDNVVQAVRRVGDSKAVVDATCAQEVLFRGKVPRKAIKLIKRR